MPTEALITSRDSKGLHAVGLFEAAYNGMKLTADRAQRLNENGGELQAGIRELITRLSATNQFANEEVTPAYGYPLEYTGPKPIEDQVAMVAEIFNLDPTAALEFAKSLPPVPDGAEGYFAVPKVDAIAAKHFPEIVDPAERYCAAVRLVLQKLADSRKFQNYREGQITSAQLRMAARTAHALDVLSEQQPGDTLIIAAQVGRRHGGRSVRRARELFIGTEFGLTSLMVGTIALVHPERLVKWKELEIDCAGDEFSPAADGEFAYSPIFRFDGGGLKFGAKDVSLASDSCGSGSGFVPQQQ